MTRLLARACRRRRARRRSRARERGAHRLRGRGSRCCRSGRRARVRRRDGAAARRGDRRSCSRWWWGSARLDALDRSVARAPTSAAPDGARRRHRRAARRQLRPAPVRAASAVRGRAVDERVSSSCRSDARRPGRRLSVLAVVRAAARAEHGFDERTWLRRQGVHVVLHVDEWTQSGAAAGSAASPTGCAVARARHRARSRRESGARSSKGSCSATTRGSRDGLKTSFRRVGALPPAGGLRPERRPDRGRRARPRLAARPAAGGRPRRSARGDRRVRARGGPAAVGDPGGGLGRCRLGRLARRTGRDPWHALLLAALVLLALEPVHALRPGLPALVRGGASAIFVAVGPAAARPRGLSAAAALATGDRGLGAAASRRRRSSGCGSARCRCSAFSRTHSSSRSSASLLGLGLVTACVDLVAPGAAALLAWLNGWIAAYVAAVRAASPPRRSRRRRAVRAAVAGVGALGVAAYAWRRWQTSFNRRT